MRVIAAGAILVFAVSGWAQSLGDVARADREREKPRARKIITNDNLQDPTVDEKPAAVEKKAESLADMWRENRERPRARMVITNDNLHASSIEPEPTDPLQRDLFRMRRILRGICADPRTQDGSVLSDEDKQAMDEGVKPLRVRILELQRIFKKYDKLFLAVDQEFEPKIIKAVYTGRPLTDADLQRVKALREEHDARRAELTKQLEHDVEAYKSLQQEIVAVGDECPAAAATVPD